MSNAFYDILVFQLRYDAETGHFYWLKNNKRAGYKAPDGRVYIRISDATLPKAKLYLVHRLAWLYVTKDWPVGVVDHIDRNPNNNSFKNLRDVSMSVNQHNRSAGKNNTSGKKGVQWNNINKTWRAFLMVNYKRINVGSFKSFEAACEAYKQAELTHRGETYD